MKMFFSRIKSRFSKKSFDPVDNTEKKNFFSGIPDALLFSKIINIQTIITGACLGFGTMLYSEYSKPDSFVRYNADKLISFFTDVVGSNVQSALSRTSACIKSAKKDTPIKEVILCIIE